MNHQTKTTLVAVSAVCLALLALGILLASCIALRATQANVIELMGGAQ
jgi:hypothetical protein